MAKATALKLNKTTGSKKTSTKKQSLSAKRAKTASITSMAPKGFGKAISWYKGLSSAEKAMIMKAMVFLVPLAIPAVRGKFPKMIKKFLA